eukprot:gene18640-13423_t
MATMYPLDAVDLHSVDWMAANGHTEGGDDFLMQPLPLVPHDDFFALASSYLQHTGGGGPHDASGAATSGLDPALMYPPHLHHLSSYDEEEGLAGQWLLPSDAMAAPGMGYPQLDQYSMMGGFDGHAPIDWASSSLDDGEEQKRLYDIHTPQPAVDADSSFPHHHHHQQQHQLQHHHHRSHHHLAFGEPSVVYYE